jgi:hypothetical protein
MVLGPRRPACEQRLSRLRRDGGAARSALPELTAELRRCSGILAAVAREHRRAIWRTAVEEVERYAREIWLPAMNQAVAASAPLESLRAELSAAGHRGVDPDPVALSCSNG